MNEAIIHAAIERIDAERDIELRNLMAEELRAAVMEAIAKVTCANPAVCCALALRTRDTPPVDGRHDP